MWMRSALAALDVNANASRGQAIDTSGALRWRIKVDRFGKFTAQAVKQEKCDQWKKDIVHLVSNAIIFQTIWMLVFEQWVII